MLSPQNDLSVAALKATLDVLPDHIVLLDADGRILHTNAAWHRFTVENGGAIRDWTGVSYLAIDPQSAAIDPTTQGIRSVLQGDSNRFEHIYECHAPDYLRWFRLTATRIDIDGVGALVSHADVTDERTTARELGTAAIYDDATGALTAEAIQAHAVQMVAEGREVSVVRVRVKDQLVGAPDDTRRRIAGLLPGLLPRHAKVGSIEDGFLVVLGAATEGALYEMLSAMHSRIRQVVPEVTLLLTAERLARQDSDRLHRLVASTPDS